MHSTPRRTRYRPSAPPSANRSRPQRPLAHSLHASDLSADKRYIGYIAGTLYLHQDNVLDRLLGQHFHRDDSVLRVMDRNGTLIYDRDRSMLGKPAAELQALAPAARRDGRIALRRRSGPRDAGRLCAGAEHGLEPHRTATGGGTLQPLSDLLLATARNTPAPAVVVHRVALAAVQADRQAAGRTCRLRQAHAGPGFRRRHTRRALLVLRGDPAQARTADGPGVHAPQDARPAPQERHRHADRPAQPPRPEEAMAMLQAEDTPVAIVVIDIDHFKNITTAMATPLATGRYRGWPGRWWTAPAPAIRWPARAAKNS